MLRSTLQFEPFHIFLQIQPLIQYPEAPLKNAGIFVHQQPDQRYSERSPRAVQSHYKGAGQLHRLRYPVPKWLLFLN